MVNRTPYEQIKQRRSQMLIHSYLYYKRFESLVDDHTWQKWADELMILQSKYDPNIDFYDEEFIGWNGDTGMHLPSDKWVVEQSNYILKISEERS